MLLCAATAQGATRTRLAHRRRNVRTHCLKCLTLGGESRSPLRAVQPPRPASQSGAQLRFTDLQRTLLTSTHTTNRRVARMCADAKGSGDVSRVNADVQSVEHGSTGSEADQDASVSPEEDNKQRKSAGEGKEDKPEDQGVGVTVALAVLRFYKREISPILPPACRFLPTCSEYAMESYQMYGVGKGTVLTAWRLLRCNPFGPSGYDPVKWPPPGLEWMIKS